MAIERKIPEVLDLADACLFVRVSDKTLRHLAQTGAIPAQKVGREWRFLRRALEDWLVSGTSSRSMPAARPQSSQQTNPLPFPVATTPPASKPGFRDSAFTDNRTELLHRWVPWIAGFSSAFVRDVLDRLDGQDAPVVLDPFAGVGTTLVEAVRRGCDAVGFEINPYAVLACRTKVLAFTVDVGRLRERCEAFTESVAKRTADVAVMPTGEPPAGFRSRAPFFSPSVERQVLFALDFVTGERDPVVSDFLRLALGATMVGYSNYSYEPSLGRRAAAGKADIIDADVAGTLGAKLAEICTDISDLQDEFRHLHRTPRARVHADSYLDSWRRVPPLSVDALITSPPYLNNYHYVRNTRPQLYWLDLVTDNVDLRSMEHRSFGKFWQTVRGGPTIELAIDYPQLRSLIGDLSEMNTHKGVYGGRGWANYAAAYFNDCHRFCESTLELMKPGGLVVVVIGNNILQGMEIRTDEFFAGIAERFGFAVAGMHRVREKRTGNSIINSSVRNGGAEERTSLYETAVELRAPVN